MLPDQINDSLQYQILPWHRNPHGECLRNEPPDVTVNCISAPRPPMPIDDLQRLLWCHVASGHPKDTIHDHCQIYDVARHTADILWAIGYESQPGSWKKDHGHLLTGLYTCRWPNPGNHQQLKHDRNYEKLPLSISLISQRWGLR